MNFFGIFGLRDAEKELLSIAAAQNKIIAQICEDLSIVEDELRKLVIDNEEK